MERKQIYFALKFPPRPWVDFIIVKVGCKAISRSGLNIREAFFGIMLGAKCKSLA